MSEPGPGPERRPVTGEVVRGLRAENETLRRIVADLAWMARRYCDQRATYAPGLYNDHVRTLLALGVTLKPGADRTIWARDAMGRAFDGLTPAQVAEIEAAERTAQERDGRTG